MKNWSESGVAYTSLEPRSRLPLAFELIKEAPIGTLGDDLLRAPLDENAYHEDVGYKIPSVLRQVRPRFGDFRPIAVGIRRKCREHPVIPLCRLDGAGGAGRGCRRRNRSKAVRQDLVRRL